MTRRPGTTAAQPWPTSGPAAHRPGSAPAAAHHARAQAGARGGRDRKPFDTAPPGWQAARMTYRIETPTAR